MGKRDKNKDQSKLTSMLPGLRTSLLKDLSKFIGGTSNHNSNDDNSGITDDCPQ